MSWTALLTAQIKNAEATDAEVVAETVIFCTVRDITALQREHAQMLPALLTAEQEIADLSQTDAEQFLIAEHVIPLLENTVQQTEYV